MESGKNAPHQIVATVSMQCSGFVIIAAPYYPGWQAYLDGKRVPIYPAYGALRHCRRGRPAPDGIRLSASLGLRRSCVDRARVTDRGCALDRRAEAGKPEVGGSRNRLYS